MASKCSERQDITGWMNPVEFREKTQEFAGDATLGSERGNEHLEAMRLPMKVRDPAARSVSF